MTSYDIRHDKFSSQLVTGITGNRYIFGNLSPDTTYIFRIRARRLNEISSWAFFTMITTAPSEGSDYAFDSAAPLTLTAGSGRLLSYSLTTSVDSGVAFFQIRYRQYPGTGDSEAVRSDWRLLDNPILNGFSSGQRAFSGSFDPGFSGRIYQVEIRAFIDAEVGSTRGFSAWAPASNSVTSSGETYSSSIQAGE